MNRVIGTADSMSTDVVVEIPDDCQIIYYQIIEKQTIRIFNANHADYVSNGHFRSYSDGMDTRVFSLEILKSSAKMTSDAKNIWGRKSF